MFISVFDEQLIVVLFIICTCCVNCFSVHKYLGVPSLLVMGPPTVNKRDTAHASLSEGYPGKNRKVNQSLQLPHTCMMEVRHLPAIGEQGAAAYHAEL